MTVFLCVFGIFLVGKFCCQGAMTVVPLEGSMDWHSWLPITIANVSSLPSVTTPPTNGLEALTVEVAAAEYTQWNDDLLGELWSLTTFMTTFPALNAWDMSFGWHTPTSSVKGSIMIYVDWKAKCLIEPHDQPDHNSPTSNFQHCEPNGLRSLNEQIEQINSKQQVFDTLCHTSCYCQICKI